MEKTQKTANLFFIAALILVCLGLFFGANPNFPWNPVDEMSWLEWFSRIPRDYQNHFNASSPLNDIFIKTIHDFQYARLFESRFPIVLGGKDGWLYYSGERNIDDYQNAFPISEEELLTIYMNLENLNRRMEARGRKLIVVVAPSRETVYPEWLPNNTEKVGEDDRMDQLMGFMNRLDSKVTILDLRDELVAAKHEYPLLYFKMDTHWNQYGAFLAYQEICKAIQADPDFSDFVCKSKDDYIIETTQYEGDMVKLMPTTLDLTESIPVFIPQFESPVQANRVRGIHERDRIEWMTSYISPNESPNPYTLVSFRDSFFMDVVPFLQEDFQETTFEWNFHYNNALVQEKDPDIVIIEVVERYVHALAWFTD